MPIEVGSVGAICSRCGDGFARRTGNFLVSYAALHKGTGFIHICRNCTDVLYNEYLSQCHNTKDAVRQVCRKLDLYWNDSIYEQVERKSAPRSMMGQYISKIHTSKYAGKSYDDTLSEEGTLWNFSPNEAVITAQTKISTGVIDNSSKEDIDSVPEDVIAFWGTGYTPSMYAELEQRRVYWMSEFPEDVELDIGTKAIIRQICSLELDINRDRAAGRAVDKSINALNSLLGSANLKPAQRRNDDIESELASTPLGVWLYRYENKRPLPKTEASLHDVNGIKKYIFTWMGHLCKMLDIKNGYTKLYEDEVSRLRVDKPEYVDEDDENLLIDSYSEETGGE